MSCYQKTQRRHEWQISNSCPLKDWRSFGSSIQRKPLQGTNALQVALPVSQVYRACQMGYWRASKRWCKQLPSETVNKALAVFANNQAGLRPSDVYGGPSGAIAQLQQLAAWFQVRGDFCMPAD